MKKKGQLTIFIILGLLLIISASVSIYFYNYIQTKKSETQVVTMLKKPAAAALAGFCSDGTKTGECSKAKPFVCEAGELVANCGECGCLLNANCLPDGSCEKPLTRAPTGFTIYFLPINYDPKEKEFLERVTLIKLNLAMELGLGEENFVAVDEPLLFPTEQCENATYRFHSFVDSWLQRRTGQGLPGMNFTSGIPVFKYRILGIDKNEQKLERCGCGYTFIYSPLAYIGGAKCSKAVHSASHELGHGFGLCDEYDSCVWESTSKDLSSAFGHPCLNAKPDSQNSDCGDSCCAADRACCAGRYADFRQDGYSNVMGSSDIPPERRMSTETKLIIDNFLCTNLGFCAGKQKPAAGLAAPQKIVDAELLISRNGMAKLRSIKAGIGTVDQPSGFAQDWQVKLGDYSSNLPVVFTMLKEPPAAIEEVVVSKKLPYAGNIGRLEVGYQGRAVLSFDMKELCNSDGFCDRFENSISCADDCPSDEIDEVCVAASDAICDPDCLGAIDPDCVEEKVAPAPLPKKTVWGFALSLFGFVFSLLLTIYLLTRKRKRKR